MSVVANNPNLKTGKHGTPDPAPGELDKQGKGAPQVVKVTQGSQGAQNPSGVPVTRANEAGKERNEAGKEGAWPKEGTPKERREGEESWAKERKEGKEAPGVAAGYAQGKEGVQAMHGEWANEDVQNKFGLRDQEDTWKDNSQRVKTHGAQGTEGWYGEGIEKPQHDEPGRQQQQQQQHHIPGGYAEGSQVIPGTSAGTQGGYTQGMEGGYAQGMQGDYMQGMQGGYTRTTEGGYQGGNPGGFTQHTEPAPESPEEAKGRLPKEGAERKK
jgi:hypothetical protein